MEYNKHKVDEAILALLYLNSFVDHEVVRAWKGFDWDALDRLHDAGFISNPKSKAKSVMLSDEGQQAAEALFKKLFGA
jgi:hypothetical protein